MDVEQVALELNDMANHIYASKQMENHPAIQAMTQQNSFQDLLTAATNTSKEEKNQNMLSSSFKFKP